MNINSTYGLKQVAEMGLRPTHGNVVDNNSRNVIAIQFTGVAGNLRIYRRWKQEPPLLVFLSLK